MKKVLYWSQQGEICCDDHGPYRGSDTWRNDRWKKMTAAEIASFSKQIGRPVDCETCDSHRRHG